MFRTRGTDDPEPGARPAWQTPPMIPALILAGVAVALRSLLAGWFDRLLLGAPVVMVLAGVAAAFALPGDALALTLNTQVAQRVTELLLAVLLFVGATAVRGGRLWGPAPGPVLRLLFLAMPLSLAAAVGTGLVLLPELGWAALLVLACVVVPIDFAPAEGVVRDRALPHRVRTALNVESGYNDGIVSPIFLFALILAGDRTQERTAGEALATVVPFALKAILLGAVLGIVIGWLMERATSAGWTTESTRRIAVLAVPLLAYFLTVSVDGNGFVASFVCGIAFRSAHRYAHLHRRREAAVPDAAISPDDDYRFLLDTTAVLTLAMWFVVGTATVVAFSDGVPWRVVIFCLAALTVVRIVPVQLAMLGTSYRRRERMLLGLLGPRGTTTIVFGLLAVNSLPAGQSDTVLLITVICVLGSVLLYGPWSADLSRALVGLRSARRRASRSGS